MKERGVAPVLIVLLVVGLIGAGIGAYVISQRGQQSGQQHLVTKDVREMTLSQDDLSEKYSLMDSTYNNGPSEVADVMQPYSKAIWKEWGFVERSFRGWEKEDVINPLTANVARYSKTSGASSAFQYRYNSEKEGAESSEKISISSVDIGDESFAVSSRFYFPSIGMDEKATSIYFREKNIVVNVRAEGSVSEVMEFAQIIDARIISSQSGQQSEEEETVKTAEFQVSNLRVNPTQPKPEETVTISVDVSNVGGVEGSHTVKMKINGELENEKKVTLSPNETIQITFNTTKNTSKSYSVKIGTLSSSFGVLSPAEGVRENLTEGTRVEGENGVFFSGKGDKTTSSFSLEKGKVIVGVSTIGANFLIVEVEGIDTGEYYSLSPPIPRTGGAETIEVEGGDYQLEVSTDGTWGIGFLQVYPSSGGQENEKGQTEENKEPSQTEGQVFDVSGKIIENVTIAVNYDNWKSNVTYSVPAKGTYYIYDIGRNLVHTYTFPSYSTNESGFWGGYIPAGEDGYIQLKATSEDGQVEWWPSEDNLYKVNR